MSEQIHFLYRRERMVSVCANIKKVFCQKTWLHWLHGYPPGWSGSEGNFCNQTLGYTWLHGLSHRAEKTRQKGCNHRNRKKNTRFLFQKKRGYAGNVGNVGNRGNTPG